MLTEPVNGRCKFLLFDFEVQISCVRDIPVDWLRACKDGLEGGSSVLIPVSLILLDNGYEYATLLFSETGILSVIDIIDDNRTVFHYDVSLAEFTEKLLQDIEDNLAGWAKWYPAEILGGPDSGREEMLRTLLADTKEALAVYAKKRISGQRVFMEEEEERGRCYEWNDM